MEDQIVILPAAAMPCIRRALRIGLFCESEVGRVRDNIQAIDPDADPDMVRMPKHPTGCHEATTFADALQWLEYADDPECESWRERNMPAKAKEG